MLIFIQAAWREERRTLLYGPPGLGKTTLANIVPMNWEWAYITSGRY